MSSETQKSEIEYRSSLLKPPTYVEVMVEFMETLLGTVPKDPELVARYLAEKVRKRKDLTDQEKEELIKEECATAFEQMKQEEQKGYTGFYKDEDGYWTYNYWILGFMKSAYQALMETGDLEKLPVWRTRLNRFIHIKERRLHFIRAEGEEAEKETDWVLEVLTRPLRAKTPQGERVALARSDVLPAGTRLKWTFELLPNPKITTNDLRIALEFGLYEGMGQWRSGGYGTFKVVEFNVIKPEKKKAA